MMPKILDNSLPSQTYWINLYPFIKNETCWQIELNYLGW